MNTRTRTSLSTVKRSAADAGNMAASTSVKKPEVQLMMVFDDTLVRFSDTLQGYGHWQ